MSDTAAFLAGCAVTGVAVLFVMRNDFASSRTGVPPSIQPPIIQTPYTPIPVPPSPNGTEEGRSFRLETELDQQRNLARDLTDQIKRQQERADELRNQLERQQRQTDDLKSQLERQERNTEILIARMQEQQRVIDRISDQPLKTQLPTPTEFAPSQAEPSNLYAIVTGAIGIIVLVVVAGGGLVLFTIIIVVLFSTRRRRTRTVHIVHPYASSYAAQPQALLPARVRSRPARHVDVEYYHDQDYD